MVERQDGTLTLTRCFARWAAWADIRIAMAASEYYIGEKMRDNDAKSNRTVHYGLSGAE